MVARKAGAKLVLNSDAHEPKDLLDKDIAKKIILAAGLSLAQANTVFKNSEEIVKRF